MSIQLKYKIEVSLQKGEEDKTIYTPFDISFQDIKQIYVEQSISKIKHMSIYPNGLIVYMETEPGKAFVRSNWPIQDINGKLTVIEP